MDSASTAIQLVDYKLLEREIDAVLSLRPIAAPAQYLSTSPLAFEREHFLVHRKRMLDWKTSMKVLYDECPSEFQFGIKQARLLAQATLLNAGPGVGAYSPFISTSMQAAIRTSNGLFKIDEYSFFDHVYLMTVNLSKLTKQNMTDLERFVREVSLICNWSDPHLALCCYQTCNVLDDGSQRRVFGSNLAVFGIFVRDFHRFLVAQLYERRHLRMSAN